jgi:surface antigen Omp85-like protein
VKSSTNSRRHCWLLTFFLASQVCWAVSCVSLRAQDLPEQPVQFPTAESTSAPDTAGHQAVTPNQESSNEKANPRRGEFVLAPLPISSPALGTGLVPVLGYIFPLSSKDKSSPPSVIGGAGLVTDNGSAAFVLAGDFYFKEDTYRATVAYFHGNLNYNLYGVGTNAGNADLRLPLTQDGQAFFVEFLRRLGWKFFLGPRFLSGDSTITIRSGGDAIPAPADVGLRTSLRALGAHLQRDTRPNRFYPTTGMFLNFTADFFSEGLGSKYSFQSYRFNFSKYGSLSKKQVLAYNFAICGTGGLPPFYGNCIYGTNNQLRGYTAGRYLDRYMVSTQLEYRLELPKRFGIVGFGGIGEVVPGGDQLFRSKNFLPAGGGGARFALSKKYHVNLRADIAVGKNNHTWAMGVGEAF